MASSINLPSYSALASNTLNADGTPISQSFAPVNGSMFRNRIINGNFDIWQRATSQTSSGYGSSDRWFNEHLGSTKTTSRQPFTLGQTSVPNNPLYFSRTVVTSVANIANYVSKKQSIEGVWNFAGQSATLSFWAKTDANKNIAIEFTQAFGTGGSPSTTITGIGVTTLALTTAWQKFTVTVSIPSISGKTLGTNGDDCLVVNFWFDAGSNYNARTNTLGQQSGTFDFSQIQIEAGSSATPFEFRPIGTEQNLCERYYEVGDFSWIGNFTSAAAIRMSLPFKVTKRVAVTTLTVTRTYSDGTLTGVTPSISSGVKSAVFVQAISTGASGQSEITGNWTASAEL